MPKPLSVWITTNWKILQEMGIQDHLTCLLRNLYAGQEGTVRTGHGTTDWFQIGKGVHQGCILSPCLFNLYAEYIMRNAWLDEAFLLVNYKVIPSQKHENHASPTFCQPLTKSLVLINTGLHLLLPLLSLRPSPCPLPSSWMKLESRLPEEISITSDMQITPSLWQKVKNN